MGTVIQLKKQINNSYSELKNSVEDKLVLVEERIKTQLTSNVNLVQDEWKKIESIVNSWFCKTMRISERWERYQFSSLHRINS